VGLATWGEIPGTAALGLHSGLRHNLETHHVFEALTTRLRVSGLGPFLWRQRLTESEFA